MSLHKFTILRHGNQNDDVKLPRQVRYDVKIMHTALYLIIIATV